MAKLEIFGPNKLEGEIAVFGAKNAAMKMIAASVLIKGKVILQNVPDILDIQNIINILVENGASITRSGHILEIDTINLSSKDPNPKLVQKMRGSVVLIGPYLSRFGKITIPQPGGCVIGSRPIDIHLDAFRQLGAKIQENDSFHLEASKLEGKTINLKGVSVTATENALMATVLTEGKTIINNCAKEPEIVDLASFLNQAGARISGAGTEKIEIVGVKNLQPVTYKVIPDRIEAGTFLALAVVTKSALKITNCYPKDLTAFLNKLKEIGVEFEIGNDFIYIKEPKELSATGVITAPYPGFPTDLQAPMGLILTQAEGKSTINEKVHENRLNYLKELAQMGAKINLIDNHQAEIEGPTPLHGANLESLDLRSGATLILAGLSARGKTTINHVEIIDRGYEKIESRIRDLGGRIERVEN